MNDAADVDGAVHFATADGVASIVFDRPEARNAMTSAMYNQLDAACAAIAGDSNVRVATAKISESGCGRFWPSSTPNGPAASPPRSSRGVAATKSSLARL